MDGQALAGEYIGATANLQAIARYYLGADVWVRWQPSQHWLGLARRIAQGAEVLINPYAPAADLGHIFFHELAHLVHGHVLIISTQTAADLADDDTAAHLERLTLPERATIGAIIDVREAEADRWAYEALEAFEGRFGPFLQAIR